MTASNDIDDYDPSRTYVSETELAHRWCMTRAGLANLRAAGRSPIPYTKPLGRVLYDIADVIAHETKQRRAA